MFCISEVLKYIMEIYLITDQTNGKQYVGQTTQTKEKRWSSHLVGDLYVDCAIRKHGVENITLETLEYVYDKNLLDEKEKYWINKLDTLIPNGYNVLPGGDCGYGRNTVHEFNKEQYLRKIFYPPTRRRSAIKCKIYTINRQDLSQLIRESVKSGPYKSGGDFTGLSQEEWVYWYRFTNNFEQRVFDVVGHNDLCKIAKKISYAPSMSYLSENSFDDYGVDIDVNTISKCIHEKMLLRLVSEYEPNDEFDYLYIVKSEDENEYIEFAEKKIQSILDDWDAHPEKLSEIVDANRRDVQLKTQNKERLEKEQRKRIYYCLRDFLYLYANRFSHTGDANSGFVAKVSVGFDKYNSGVCNDEIDAFVKCKDWIISALAMDNNAFEQYVSEREHEQDLIKKRKWKEYKEFKASREAREKSICAAKRNRK